jgi:hypothetical protein
LPTSRTLLLLFFALGAWVKPVLPQQDINIEDFIEEVPNPDAPKADPYYQGKPPEKFEPDRHLKDQAWFTMSSSISYVMLGNEFERVIGQIEGVFAGEPVTMNLLNFSPTFTMQSAEKIEREPTYFLPTGNLGLLFRTDNFFWGIDFGFAGLVPLKTVDTSSQMLLTENCNASDLSTCPLATLGFVNQSTLQGQYRLRLTLNEDIWLITGLLNAEYILWEYGFHSWSVGIIGGGVFLSTNQKLQFLAERLDTEPLLGQDPALAERKLQGLGYSNNFNNWGPLIRLHTTARFKLFGLRNFARLGVTYSYVNLERHIDGNGQAIMGETLAASFPLEAIGFANRETNKFDLSGISLQVGMEL